MFKPTRRRSRSSFQHQPPPPPPLASPSTTASSAGVPSGTSGEPAWFTEAINEQVESFHVDVKLSSSSPENPNPGEVAPVHCLRWGASSTKRPLVLIHGGAAHANWYRFIGPFFSVEYDVVAISQSGNGKSGNRDSYSLAAWAEEIMEVCRKLGFFSSPTRPKPYILAHSLGTYVVTHMFRYTRLVEQNLDPTKLFAGCVLVDGAIRPYELSEKIHNAVQEVRAKDPNTKLREGWKINPYTTTPMERFKLRPYQECANTYILKFIAESNSRIVDEQEGTWMWEGDPNREARFDWSKTKIFSDQDVRAIAEAGVSVTFMYGEDSVLCDASVAQHVHESLGDCVGIIGVPQAAHHVWLDQPLAFITSVRGVFAGWSVSQQAKEKRSNVPFDESDIVRREAILESRL